MPTYQSADHGQALDSHVRGYFAGHRVALRAWPRGPIEARIRGFRVYEVGPGDRFSGWTYVSAGCWRATAADSHGLEFVLSAGASDPRNVEIVAMAAYYHAGGPSQRLDLGHTVPIGEPWITGGTVDHLMVSLPYPYGPGLEELAWRTGRARLLSLMPITRAERDFKAQHGVGALEARLEQAAVDFIDPARPSVA